eukprot:SAG22_NODE_1012_length_6040_cov_4.791449_5_plen_335_part_01
MPPLLAARRPRPVLVARAVFLFGCLAARLHSQDPGGCDADCRAIDCDTSATLAAQCGRVSAECCDEASEVCSDGFPATCNAGCAAVLLPVTAACRAYLARTQPQSNQIRDMLLAAADQCAVPTPAAATTCGETMRAAQCTVSSPRTCAACAHNQGLGLGSSSGSPTSPGPRCSAAAVTAICNGKPDPTTAGGLGPPTKQPPPPPAAAPGDAEAAQLQRLARRSISGVWLSARGHGDLAEVAGQAFVVGAGGSGLAVKWADAEVGDNRWDWAATDAGWAAAAAAGFFIETGLHAGPDLPGWAYTRAAGSASSVPRVAIAPPAANGAAGGKDEPPPP